MTAIALLNSENDPHVVADTLLSADGTDPNEEKTIWLPALGQVDSEWENDEGKWYIPRLGRKTFAVPISSGLLAFAGRCSSAFRFWDELSAEFINRQSYDQRSTITNDIVERILHNSREALQFSLLGAVKDRNGNLVPVIHRPDIVINTKNYGICYIAGSGAELLKEIILERDEFISSVAVSSNNIKCSVTEELAEYISAEMLYKESDFRNGLLKGTPLAHYCGGFYEWYGLKNQGAKVLQPRVDMHVVLDEHEIFITRLILSEQYIIPSSGDSIYSSKYPILVVNFISDYIKIGYASLLKQNLSIFPKEIHAVYIDSTFSGYEEDSTYVPRSSGKLNNKIAESCFGVQVNVNRIRLFISSGDKTITKGFISTATSECYVKVSYENNQFSITIDDTVKNYILSKLLLK